MSRTLAVAALLLAPAAAPAQKTTAAVAKQFGWHTEYAPALAEAKKTGKPIFLVFRCEP